MIVKTAVLGTWDLTEKQFKEMSQLKISVGGYGGRACGLVGPDGRAYVVVVLPFMNSTSSIISVLGQLTAPNGGEG